MFMVLCIVFSVQYFVFSVQYLRPYTLDPKHEAPNATLSTPNTKPGCAFDRRKFSI